MNLNTYLGFKFIATKTLKAHIRERRVHDCGEIKKGRTEILSEDGRGEEWDGIKKKGTFIYY